MNNSKFFSNKECEYFPCHGIKDGEIFNCMFCYCPLYFLEECIGSYEILDNGVKDCSNCTVPHGIDSRDIIINYLIGKGYF